MILTSVLRFSAVLCYNPKEKEESKIQERYFLYQPGFIQSLCRPSIKKHRENKLDDKQCTIKSNEIKTSIQTNPNKSIKPKESTPKTSKKKSLVTTKIVQTKRISPRLQKNNKTYQTKYKIKNHGLLNADACDAVDFFGPTFYLDKRSFDLQDRATKYADMYRKYLEALDEKARNDNTESFVQPVLSCDSALYKRRKNQKKDD